MRRCHVLFSIDRVTMFFSRWVGTRNFFLKSVLFYPKILDFKHFSSKIMKKNFTSIFFFFFFNEKSLNCDKYLKKHKFFNANCSIKAMNSLVFLCFNENLRKTGQIRSKSGHGTFDEKTGLSRQIYSRWSP